MRRHWRPDMPALLPPARMHQCSGSSRSCLRGPDGPRGASTWTSPALRRSYRARENAGQSKIRITKVSTVPGEPREGLPRSRGAHGPDAMARRRRGPGRRRGKLVGRTLTAVAARCIAGAERGSYIRPVARAFTGAPPGTRTPNPRIQSLSMASSLGFMGVRAAGRTACVYPGELGWTAVNCNPKCNAER